MRSEKSHVERTFEVQEKMARSKVSMQAYEAAAQWQIAINLALLADLLQIQFERPKNDHS